MNWFDALKDQLSPSFDPPEPRRLTVQDLTAFQDAQDERFSKRELRRIEDVRAEISKVNPVKFWQMRRDFKWLQRQMKKLGLNPEDARYIL